MEDDGDDGEERKEAPKAPSNVPLRFQGKSLYDVLSVAKDATSEQIKKAYRRMALTCHPDLNKSPQATEEFQYLSRCHEILSDPVKRKHYDLTGSIDGAEAEEDNVDAYEYWRGIFPKISLEDIEAYQKKYEGSEEEKEDLLEAWEQYDGDLQSIFESVPFASASSVARLCAILNAEAGAKLTRAQIAAFKKSLSEMENDEAEVAEEALQNLSARDRALLKGDQKKHSATGGHETAGLALVLAARAKERAKSGGAFLNHMEEKYRRMEEEERKSNGTGASSTSGRAKRKPNAKEADEEDDVDADGDANMGEPSEEEFAAIQARILQNRAANSGKKASPAKKARKGGK